MAGPVSLRRLRFSIKPRSKFHAIKALTSRSLPISAVVDVGVASGTPELQRALPALTHFLFEPNPEMSESILRNYRKIDFRLWVTSVGESTESRDSVKNGFPAQHQVNAAYKSVKLDDLASEFPDNFLLKIDTDGMELEVLRGAKETLRNASVVVIETTYSNIAAVTSFLYDFNFSLVDIVELFRFRWGFYQGDFVFVRKDQINKAIRPAQEDFSPSEVTGWT